MTEPIRAKSSPQIVDGELVKVARAQNQAEAEFVQGLLLEMGVPSILRPIARVRRSRLPRGRTAGRARAGVGGGDRT